MTEKLGHNGIRKVNRLSKALRPVDYDAVLDSAFDDDHLALAEMSPDWWDLGEGSRQKRRHIDTAS